MQQRIWNAARRSARQSLRIGVVASMLVAVVAVVAPAAPAGAATCSKTWNLAGDGSWNTAGNWTPSGVPTATDVVCLKGSTTYTVTLDNAFSAKSFQIGGTAGAQTLLIDTTCSANASLTVTAASSLNAKGRLTFDSASCNNTSSLISTSATPVLSNGGIITFATTGGAGQRNLEMSTTNTGTINVHLSASAVGTYTLVNNGAINIDSGQTFDWANGDATNGAGGSITGVGDFTMEGGTFHEGAGTTTGSAPTLTDTNIDYTGAGASTLTARGDATTDMLSGNISAGQTLQMYADCTRHSARHFNSGFTNAGTILMDSLSCNNNASLVAASPALVLTNTGTITAAVTNLGQRNLETSVTNSGTINTNETFSAVGTYTFVNNGTINIANTEIFDWHDGDFTNGAGGHIVATGTGDFSMAGGTFHEGAGTTSGTPPTLTDTNIAYAGKGASTLTARGDTAGVTLSGNIGTAQTLQMYADCTRHSARTVNNSFTNAGTIVMDSITCNNNVSLIAPSATPVLTNTGTITSSVTNDGQRNLEMSVTNNGTINVNLTISAVASRKFINNTGTINVANKQQLNWKGGAFTLAGGVIHGIGSGKVSGGGLFTQGNGSTTGSGPISRSGSITYTGTGSSIIVASGTSGTLSGTLVAGQKLTLDATCKAHVARQISGNVTNGGVILLKSGSCNDNASLTSADATPVFTNNGTLTADATLGGQRNLEVTTVNNGTINANQSMDSVVTRTFTNNGTINIGAGMNFNWENGDFTDAAAGTINAGTGSLVMHGGTYHQGDGAATGAAPVVMDDGNIDFNGVGPSAASTVIAEGTTGTLTGRIRANQNLVINATCPEHATRATTAATFTNSGTITLQSTGCNNNATLDASAGTLANAGTLIVDDTTAGQRLIDGNVNNTGTVMLGVTALTHNGATFQSNGAASKIQVRVASASSFGVVNSTGAFQLGGKLAIATDSGFWPAAGLNFAILNGASARTGTFASTTGLTRSGETVAYSVQYTANGVNLHTA
jgi:hypothetical protein